MNTLSQTQDLCMAEIAIERILPCRQKSKWVDSFFYKARWNDHPTYIKAMCYLSLPFVYADYLVDLYTDEERRQTFYLGELGYRTFTKYYIV